MPSETKVSSSVLTGGIARVAFQDFITFSCTGLRFFTTPLKQRASKNTHAGHVYVSN